MPQDAIAQLTFLTDMPTRVRPISTNPTYEKPLRRPLKIGRAHV